MLWYALSKFEFEEIEHIFFLSGHSQNEGDSMHSVIERSSRHVSVYTPTQWAQTMRTAKGHAPLHIVEELDQSVFFDVKKNGRASEECSAGHQERENQVVGCEKVQVAIKGTKPCSCWL